MKVLQILPTLSAGGAEGFVTNLGVSLAGLGMDVRFFLMAGVRGERGRVLFSRLKDAGIEVIGAEKHNVRSPMNILKFIWLMHSWQPDIVQANMYQTEVLTAVSRLFTAGIDATYVRRLTGTAICGYRSQKIVRLMDRFFLKTIACSPVVAEAYQVFMGTGQRSDLITIPNGGILQERVITEKEKLQVRKHLALSDNAFIVAHIGRMVGGELGTGLEYGPKAQDILLKSFARAFINRPDCMLVMVGDGPLRPAVESLAVDLGISGQLTLLGQQPEPWPVLKAADMFFFPSRHEGLPNVLPEAASCGLPVLASDIPEIRNISPGDAWLLKPVNDVAAFADGLREIAKHKFEYSRIACKVASQVRERFSMAACARCYMDEYESILKKPSRYKHM